MLLILAVALLCWSFVKQMRKVKAANEAGVYDEQADRTAPTSCRRPTPAPTREDPSVELLRIRGSGGVETA